MLHLKCGGKGVRISKDTGNIICDNSNANKCPVCHGCQFGYDCLEDMNRSD